MSDSYTTVSHQGWFSRILGSFFGALVGLLLYLGMFVLIFWNEGRAVRTHQDLEEGKQAVVEAPVDPLDSKFDGQLVHMVGSATTHELLTDEFGVKVNALKLKRIVEMYQWTEDKSTKRRKRAGGSEVTETTYSYHKRWVDHPVNSQNFHRSGHTNPGKFPVSFHQRNAEVVNFGAFELSESLREKINSFSDYVPDASVVIPGFQRHDQEFYQGRDPQSPEIGDVRIHYQVVQPTTVSVIAGQRGNSFVPFVLHSGRPQEMLTVGEHTAASMYDAAERMNQLLAWAIRGGGLLGMWLGLAMVAAPLTVLLDVLPLLGNMARWGTGAMAFALATISAALGIAVAWCFYHPVFAVMVVMIAVAVVFLVRQLFAGRARSTELNTMFAPPPPPPPPPNPA